MKINLRKVAIASATLLIGSGVLAYAIHFHPSWKVESYQQQLRAEGEQLTFEELPPSPAPSVHNNTNLFWRAASLLSTNGDVLERSPVRLVAPGKAIIGWLQPAFPDEDKNISWEKIGTALSKENDALGLFQKIIDEPTLEFEVGDATSATFRLPYMTPLIKATFRLSAKALYDLHQGDTSNAVTDIRLLLALVKGTERETFTSSQLFRMSAAYIASTDSWELLQAPGLTDDQLADLQGDWMSLQYIRPVENAVVMERVRMERILARNRKSGAELESVLMPAGFQFSARDKLRTKRKIWYWRISQSYSDELVALEGMQIILNGIRLTETNQCFDASLLLQKTQLAESRLARMGWQNLGKKSTSIRLDFNLDSWFSDETADSCCLLRRLLASELEKQLTVSAIALKRYELRHGKYPSALSQLVPEFLPAVPRDHMDGQPLRYRLNADGTFLVYSIGENGEDDGGDPAVEHFTRYSDSLDGRDLVWPQVASAKEIEDYEKEILSRRR